MELTQNYDIGVIERLQCDRDFVDALISEVDEVLLHREYPVAQELLRILVAGTVGFDALSRPLFITGEILQQVLEAAAPPPPSQLVDIVIALKRALGVATS